jgi:hypothetical protein
MFVILLIFRFVFLFCFPYVHYFVPGSQCCSFLFPIALLFFLSKLLKERLHSDGPQFHQYQQNKQSPINSDGH